MRKGRSRPWATAWRPRLPEAAKSEREMVDYSRDDTPGVRLACQIKVAQAMDGLELNLPESQHY